jgi:hypothetical protein
VILVLTPKQTLSEPLLDHLIDAHQHQSGTSMPSVLAVFRLMTSSIFVDCWTGRLAGFSPLESADASLPGEGLYLVGAMAHQAAVKTYSRAW